VFENEMALRAGRGTSFCWLSRDWNGSVTRSTGQVLTLTIRTTTGSRPAPDMT